MHRQVDEISTHHCYSVDYRHTIRLRSFAAEGARMLDPSSGDDQAQNRLIEQIVELQREFYFENKGKETERRRRLRDLIERATAATAV